MNAAGRSARRVLFYAPFPAPELVRNGWMRRIAAVDRIFADRPRTYVWPVGPDWVPDPREYRVQPREAAPGALSVTLDLRYSTHARALARLVDEAAFVYAHTSHSARHLLPFYGTGKIVTDLHGLAPEEEAMQGHAGRAALFGALEEPLVRGSALLVAVSEAMAEHFRAKHAGLETPHLVLPIVDELPAAPEGRRGEGGLSLVVYSGGTQRWQRLDAMFDAVAALRGRHRFRFYTEQADALRAALAERGLAGEVEVATLRADALQDAYARADYGFVLREDDPVNRVSCPTKLSEYLATGVVPIVDLVEIGDFARMGYRYVRLRDFLAGRLPSPSELAEMRARNREVYVALRERYREGVRRLRELSIEPPARPDAWSPWSAAGIHGLDHRATFPLDGLVLELVRGGAAHLVPLDDVVRAELEVHLPLPGRGPLESVALRSGALPLLLSPLAIEVEERGGRRVPVDIRLVARDRYGNWIFRAPGVGAASAPLGIEEPESIRLRGEILLAGHEVHSALEHRSRVRILLGRIRRRARRAVATARHRLRRS